MLFWFTYFLNVIDANDKNVYSHQGIMQPLFIAFLILVSFLSAYGQKEDAPFFLNEFSISLNRTNLSNDNTGDRIGFGIGANRVMAEQKKINLIFGFEYNWTRQFIKKTYEGHFAHATDLTYTLNNLSIPINLRLNYGNNAKLFLEAGAFVDLIFNSQRKGKMHTYAPDENNIIDLLRKSFS